METNSTMEGDAFFREYTSHDAIAKYSRATAGFGISYLLDHDYKKIYLKALAFLPDQARKRSIRILEFGCGTGMNLLHLVSGLRKEAINIGSAIGTDFSPLLIDAAKQQAENYLPDEERQRVEFCVAKNETLIKDLSSALGKSRSELENSFDFILGVNTIRYCHRAGKELDCAQDIFNLLVPGGVSVVIDMNNRFPLFRSALKNRLRGEKQKEEECYLPSLEEYAAPFVKAGFEVLRKEYFCWVPHSSGQLMTGVLSRLSPVLSALVPSRAMRSLVVARKPTE